MNKFFSLLSLFCFAASSAASAAVPQSIGEYGDWTAFYYKDGRNTVCYMASAPVKDEGKYTKRGDIYMVVTHRPQEKSFDVVNINAGYTYKDKSRVKIQIGNKTIDKLFTDGTMAWTINGQVDAELIKEMKRGSRMIVTGTSSRGTQTKDTYSLKGFNKAYMAISKKCNKKN
ncbi:MAG: hypothetical protein J6L86_07450 [Alphaproteobacteria bacterium]|nr:hypothetical protein [Alphaproteobacteria bacterium]